jgi:hypothetical protein
MYIQQLDHISVPFLDYSRPSESLWLKILRFASLCANKLTRRTWISWE